MAAFVDVLKVSRLPHWCQVQCTSKNLTPKLFQETLELKIRKWLLDAQEPTQSRWGQLMTNIVTLAFFIYIHMYTSFVKCQVLLRLRAEQTCATARSSNMSYTLFTFCFILVLVVYIHLYYVCSVCWRKRGCCSGWGQSSWGLYTLTCRNGSSQTCSSAWMQHSSCWSSRAQRMTRATWVAHGPGQEPRALPAEVSALSGNILCYACKYWLGYKLRKK